MLNQIFEIAKIVFTASYRKNLILASLLTIFPLLLAAWFFELENPGFQSGFVLDAGGGIMALLSIIIMGVLSFDHLFWPTEQPTPWFYFSRLNSRIAFLVGKFLGISIVSGIILAIFSFLLSLLIYFTSGSFVFLSFKIAFMVWSEYSLLLSVFVLLSTFCSKLMSVGMMIPLVFISHSANYIHSFMPFWLSEIILAFFPNSEIFTIALNTNEIANLLIAFLYSIFMSIFYLTIAGLVLKRRDL